MDLDEALEHVMAGEVVKRAQWGPDDVIVRYQPKDQPTIMWRTTRMISCADMVADDWKVVGYIQ